ncbi:MAG: ABC transporter permease [Chloroflexi bacterium]|nr:ABC transporter permease [Chloroflexota bacterium]MCI0577733.1 ABC transporter permease [Chloroflexota bacterium]MCI0644005.1 ABC transporter permease [Chloroflexota bacterium]MCI0731996.1 ABC transporter permease [Chloroflexota bacterium]
MTIPTIARLTIRETQRRRILWVGMLMGLAFLALFGLGFHFIHVEMVEGVEAVGGRIDEEGLEFFFTFFTLAGLYATNFLVVMVAVLTSVTTVSGEIESHTIESLLTKPVRRWEIVAGKWLGYALIIFLYVLLMPGGVLLIVYLRSGYTLQNIPAGLGLMYLEGLVGLTISVVGGTRLSTLANGALAFMLFGIGFIGGWVEQIGALLRNETAVDLGILSSLIMPTEVLWRKASSVFEPRLVTGFQFAGPFSVASQPSNAMIIYAVLYTSALLGLALWSFSRRDF